MNIKEQIKKELAIQETIDEEKCQSKILLSFLNIVKTEVQWNAFVNCRFYQYGKLSYECHRFYYPKKELLNLINL